MVYACSAADTDSAPPLVPPAILLLVEDALRAASEIKMEGDIDRVVARHPSASRYRDALYDHFAMMQKLHQVGVESGIRYPRYALNVTSRQFCSDRSTARLYVKTGVRYDMEPIPPNTATPPYTASGEEHIFHFELQGGEWAIVQHHEISLAESHDHRVASRLRNPCKEMASVNTGR